jgi:3-oxoacyl-[acyl-carrier-protein] synthase III
MADPAPALAERSGRDGVLRAAGVRSIATAVPDEAVPSATLEQRLGLSAGWIESRTGVRERRIAAPDDTLTALAATAADRALAAADADPETVDLVLVATLTPDRRMPNAAPLVAERIGASRAGALDVGAACTGFLSALAMAAGAVESGRSDAVLVIGADLLSRVTDFGDRRTAGLFGDGAGAALIRPSEGGEAIGPSRFGADGSAADLIELDQGSGETIRMNGHDTFRHAVDRLSEATETAIRLAGWQRDDVDAFVYHQANSRILKAVGERLDLDPALVPDFVGRFGNTSSATIPIALAESAREGRLTEGDRVLLAAFGAGLTWGSATMTWGSCDVG